MVIAAAPAPNPAPSDPAALALLAHPVPRCERTTKPDEILVCARDREAERHKLPLALPPDPGDPLDFSVSRERNALIERGDGGSCATPQSGRARAMAASRAICTGRRIKI